VARQNKDGKWTTFWIVKSASNGSPPVWREIDPRDGSLKDDPDLAGGEAFGQHRIENDDQVMVAICLDQAAFESRHGREGRRCPRTGIHDPAPTL
jgi:hypothetical protein